MKEEISPSRHRNLKDNNRILCTILCYKFDNLDEMDKFLGTQTHQAWIQDTEHLNRPIHSKMIESISKYLLLGKALAH